MATDIWVSIIVISLVGCGLHFLYNLCHHNKRVALFSAVNESTWEHLKIAVMPMLAWGLYDGFVYGTNPNYFIAKALSILAAIIFIIVVFYGYKAIVKKSILVIDVLIFFLAIAAGQFLFSFIINLQPLGEIYSYIGTILLFITFGLFLTSTFLPFKNFLFKDPVTKKYGIKEKLK